MIFNPENFRKLDTPVALRTDRLMTLILIKANGNATYANKCKTKEDIRLAYEEGDLLLLAWTGKYSTDIFQLTYQELLDNWS